MSKERREICKAKFFDAIDLINKGEIDIAEYGKDADFYKYYIKKIDNEIVIYTKNTDEIVFSDELTCYKFMTKEEQKEWEKHKENECCGDCRKCEKCEGLNIPPMEELDKIFGGLAREVNKRKLKPIKGGK